MSHKTVQTIKHTEPFQIPGARTISLIDNPDAQADYILAMVSLVRNASPDMALDEYNDNFSVRAALCSWRSHHEFLVDDEPVMQFVIPINIQVARFAASHIKLTFTAYFIVEKTIHDSFRDHRLYVPILNTVMETNEVLAIDLFELHTLASVPTPIEARLLMERICSRAGVGVISQMAEVPTLRKVSDSAE